MNAVKAVGLEFLGTSLGFRSLEILRFEDMQGWESWSTNKCGVVDRPFLCLQELFLSDCPNLVRVSLEALPSLKVLIINGCGNEVLRSLVRVASSVTQLNINNISGLNDELWGGVIEYLGAVEAVSINECNEIRYFWESEAKASKVLVNLRELVVRGCKNMVRLGEKEEDNCGRNLMSLTSLDIWDCHNLEHCSCPNSVKSLSIWNCNKLLENDLVGGREKTKALISSSIRILESVHITDWTNLKSITELSSFNHLTRLIIRDCPNMESFPDHELPKLGVLQSLTIVNCKKMDASFPRGLWPPKLWHLEIGGLKKPILKWGPQNFPTSLIGLGLVGGSSEDASDLSQLSHLLPSTVTTLSVIEFEKLESISIGLQHLTSLQHLFIVKCPKIIDLPETLLPSLLRLAIRESPILKERCSKRGSYWHLISLLPRFDMYN